jgi:hypothetical protein
MSEGAGGWQAARKQAQAPLGIRAGRKRLWFEKFFWFVSSDRCIVVAGRDAHQNELLVKRYMRARDVYVHADVHGAATVLVRNDAGGVVPMRTVQEAATFAVCRSKAWTAKLAGGTAAWWVHPSQVSKTPQAGEYLTTGSFVIRGKKNYVATDAALTMGFGVLFRRSGAAEGGGASARGAQDVAESGESDGGGVDPTCGESGAGVAEAQLAELAIGSDGGSSDGGTSGDERSGRSEDEENNENMENKEEENEDGASSADGDSDTDGSGDRAARRSEEVLRLLTGAPRAGDALAFALGVCAPYAALQVARPRAAPRPSLRARSRAAGARSRAAAAQH